MGEKIYCSLVDSSYHMLRVAINALDETNLSRTIYKEKMDIVAINCDFRDVHLYRDLLRLSKGARIFFAFLEGLLVILLKMRLSGQ